MPKSTIVPLADLEPGQEADFFALLTSKEELKTRDQKPYYRVGFRDARRSVAFPIWNDSPWGEECRKQWTPGVHYKLRAIYRESNYGPQLEIRKIREVVDADAADGFDPLDFLPQSRFDPQAMFDGLVQLARDRIPAEALQSLVVGLLEEHRETLLTLPAATRNHHNVVGGYLEHVLSVTRNACLLADKYATDYPDLNPPLDVGLCIAGAILHDIGKLREIEWQPEGPAYTASGRLIGHIVQGRDLLRDAERQHPLDPETLLRLEHIILSHQRLPEWGSPKPPMTPEALIVHYADDLDAKYHMMYVALRDDTTPGPFTSKQNMLYQQVYRGPTEPK